MNIEHSYLKLMQEILDNGVQKNDRTGTGTISSFGYMLEHDMSEGFPLLTTKKTFLRGIFEELKWFLEGSTNIQPLVQKNVNIWVGDSYKKYCKDYWKVCRNNVDFVEFGNSYYIEESNSYEFEPFTMEEFIDELKENDEFAEKFGELGNIYGYQWRSWGGNIDQISDAIFTLKTNPDSRRILVSAWNPGELNKMVLPPCHYAFQLYTRKLSLGERMTLATDREISWEYFTHEFADDWKIPRRALSLMWHQRLN